MSLKKITLASLILFSLTACSSGGSSSPNNDALQTELAKTKNQLASSEQLLNSTKTELAQAQTDLNTATSNLQKAQTELAKVQADNTATAQELTTAKANLVEAESAKTAAEQALATANSEKQAVETELNSAKSALSQAQTDLNTATSNLQKVQTELAKVQADNTATAQELTTAKANLTNAEQAKQQAETTLANREQVWSEIVSKSTDALKSMGIDGTMIGGVDGQNELPQGLSRHPFVGMSIEDGILVGNQYVYLSPNTDMKLFARGMTAFDDDTKFTGENFFRVDRIEGIRTIDLPQAGTAVYKGQAFAGGAIGELNYSVDFNTKTGMGNISAFNADVPNIRLEQGDIISRNVGDNHRIRAAATGEDGSNGRYFVDFFGNNAEAIGGKLYMYKTFDNVPTSNGAEMRDFDATERGTVFGIVGEKQ